MKKRKFAYVKKCLALCLTTMLTLGNLTIMQKMKTEKVFAEEAYESFINNNCVLTQYNDTPKDEMMLGDVNLDGEITLSDALIALRVALGIIELDEEQGDMADVNGKDGITLVDAQLILRRALRIITSFEDVTIDTDDKNTEKWNEEIHRNAYHAYYDVLCAFHFENSKYSMIEQSVFDMIDKERMMNKGAYDIDDNTYALCDINGDGIDELFLFVTETCNANYTTAVYRYDEEQNKAVRIDEGMYPLHFEVYDNGVIFEYMRGYENNAWCIHNYNQSNGMLEDTGYEVIPWYKDDYTSDSMIGKTFPLKYDKDGDGSIYYIYNHKTKSQQYLDNAEYETWIKQFTASAKMQELDPYGNQKVRNCEKLNEKYKTWLLEKMDSFSTDANTDLAKEFVETDGFWNIDTVDKLVEHTSGRIQHDEYDEYDDFCECYEDGKLAVAFAHPGNPEIDYCQAVDGITLFGLKPGDNVQKLIDTMKEYDFYKEQGYDSAYYVNGVGFGYAIYFDEQNGKITRITIACHCKFAG